MVSWALPQHCWDVIVQPRGGAEILVSAVGAALLPVPSVTYTGNFKKMARRTLGRTSNLGTPGPHTKRTEPLLPLLSGPKTDHLYMLLVFWFQTTRTVWLGHIFSGMDESGSGRPPF